MTTTNTTAPTTAIQPDRIEITDMSHLAFPAAAVLLSQGYTFCTVNPPEAYATGYANIFLVRGEHTADAIALAEAAEAIALARQQAAQEREAVAAARESAEAAERAEKLAQINAEIEAHQQAVRKLQRAAKAA
jgi:hypothetical protein